MTKKEHNLAPSQEEEDLFAKRQAAEAALTDDNVPVYPDLADQIKVDLVLNEKGRIWVLHDRPFPDVLEWIEFDADTNDLTFVTAKGKIQNLGIVIPRSFRKYIKRANFLNTMQINGDKIEDAGIIPLVSRDTGLQ